MIKSILVAINIAMMMLVLFGGYANQTDWFLIAIQWTALLGIWS